MENMSCTIISDLGAFTFTRTWHVSCTHNRIKKIKSSPRRVGQKLGFFPRNTVWYDMEYNGIFLYGIRYVEVLLDQLFINF